MANAAINESQDGSGLKANPLEFVFGRGNDRSRTSVAFPLTSNGKNNAPKFYRYSWGLKEWITSSPDHVVVYLPSLTRKSLHLDGGTYDTSIRGTKSGSKSWKVKVLSSQSSVSHSSGLGGTPNGVPASYTTYTINVPTWVNKWLFAQSVHAALRQQVNTWDGKNKPNVGDIVSYITPSGRTVSIEGMEALYKLSKPPAVISSHKPRVLT